MQKQADQLQTRSGCTSATHQDDGRPYLAACLPRSCALVSREKLQALGCRDQSRGSALQTCYSSMWRCLQVLCICAMRACLVRVNSSMRWLLPLSDNSLLIYRAGRPRSPGASARSSRALLCRSEVPAPDTRLAQGRNCQRLRNRRSACQQETHGSIACMHALKCPSILIYYNERQQISFRAMEVDTGRVCERMAARSTPPCSLLIAGRWWLSFERASSFYQCRITKQFQMLADCLLRSASMLFSILVQSTHV